MLSIFNRDLFTEISGVYASIAKRPKGIQNKTGLKGVGGSDDVVDEYEGWDGIIRRAVIGVPANCSEKKKEATKRAARSAGLEEVRRGAPFCSVLFCSGFHACIFTTCIPRNSCH